MNLVARPACSHVFGNGIMVVSMKPSPSFFERIHVLPEKVRYLLAGTLFFVIALILFGIWSASLSSRLESVSSYPSGVAPVVPQKEKDTQHAFGPVAGIAETLKSLETLFPTQNESQRSTHFFSALNETFPRVLSFIEGGLENIATIIY